MHNRLIDLRVPNVLVCHNLEFIGVKVEGSVRMTFELPRMRYGRCSGEAIHINQVPLALKLTLKIRTAQRQMGPSMLWTEKEVLRIVAKSSF